MRVKLLLLAIVMGAAQPSALYASAADSVASGAAPQGASKAPLILVMGDSLSAGYGIDIKQGWVALLEQRLKAQGYGYRVVNASVSGETSAGARSRLTKLLEIHRPKIVLLEIGANDGLRGLPVKQTRDNLMTMTTQTQAMGALVIICGMQMPPNYGARYTEDFAAVFRDIAKERKTPIVPFFLEGIALDMKLVQADGLHPTAAAQPILLDNVWKTLRPNLKK